MAMQPCASPLSGPFTPDASDTEPLGDLVAIAAARVARQAGYAALAAKGGVKAVALADWLDQARRCLLALARPRVMSLPLATTVTADGVVIEGLVSIRDPSWRDDIAEGAEMGATLCSLGYGQQEAFARLGRDYALHHVQGDLARETLFALARAADRARQRQRPGWRLHRIPVKAQAQCGRHQLWEPVQVQALLSLFAPGAAGVTMTETGFFNPLHSLLGLTLMRPPGGNGAQGCLS